MVLKNPVKPWHDTLNISSARCLDLSNKANYIGEEFCHIFHFDACCSPEVLWPKTSENASGFLLSVCHICFLLMRDLTIWKAGNRCVIYSQLILFSAAFCVSVVLHSHSHSVWHTQYHAHLHHPVSWPLCEALHFCCWGDRKLPYRALRKINMPCWIFHFFFSLSVCWGRAAKISIILKTKVQAIWFNLVPSLLAEPLPTSWQSAVSCCDFSR